MDDLPLTAGDYAPEDLRRVKAGCLEVATRLSGLLDEMVIVGGVVPALLIDLAKEGAGIPTEFSLGFAGGTAAISLEVASRSQPTSWPDEIKDYAYLFHVDQELGD